MIMLSACGTEEDTTTDPTQTDENVGNETGSENTTESAPSCTEPTEMKCIDNLVLDLNLKNTVAQTDISNQKESADWVTSIDATAGGFMNATDNPWIYIRFTASGAEKVEINDNESLESMDWHLAAHRYKIRLNSGSGGPSCVTASVLPEVDYELITSIPENLTYYEDDFYTADCSLIEDSWGMGTPQVFLSNWWDYPGCVATTYVPFIVQLEDGNTIKLRVEEYYEDGQDYCNETGSMGSGSANLKIRWAML
jgi:hypothetical protein